MNTFLAALPIALLVYLMTKKRSWPSYIALPLVTVLLYGLKLFYFDSDFRTLNATVIEGLLTAWTPILIIWGAIFLFRAMENTGAMSIIRQLLNGVTQNQVAQLMIIGWAFAFLIEGVSGFGTPAAIAAPLLVGLGFEPLRVAILALIMNSVPVTFGGVGTPLWFGMGQLGLTEAQLFEVGLKSALIHSVAALVIPVLALSFVVGWSTLRKNIIYIYLSILSCVIPYFCLAQLSYEFPSIGGGLIGLMASVFLAKKKLGLSEDDAPKKEALFSTASIFKATFPLWGTVMLLLITRLNPLGLKAFLNSTVSSFYISLQPLADLAISSSLVVQVNNILGVGKNVIHPLLYVPSILPFFLIGCLTFILFHRPSAFKVTWSESWSRMKKPILTLLPALVFVELLLMDGDQALTMIIGRSLAEWIGSYWSFFASYLGALGAFFSGSNTVSNLTFGGIQYGIAQDLNLNLTTILAAQAVGGAMGNMVCINNIVAVCSVLGIVNQEGMIIKKTVVPMMIYGLITGVIVLFLL